MNRGDLRFLIEILEKTESETENELGDKSIEWQSVKQVWAKLESRIGGLLSGRQADTIVSTVTHKITYNMQEYPMLEPDKNIVKFGDKYFDVNYALNEDNQGVWLQVFCTERSIKQHLEV